jgi:hypothetical protein
VTRIVRTAYRYKRPRGKRKPVTLEVPAVITAASKRKRASAEAKAALAASLKHPVEPERKPASTPERAAKAAIVTNRRQAARIIPPGLLADTPRSTAGAAMPPTRCSARSGAGSASGHEAAEAAQPEAAGVRALPGLRHGIPADR